jgi:hypothetical protein
LKSLHQGALRPDAGASLLHRRPSAAMAAVSTDSFRARRSAS